MNEELKSICFICHANYCRSPVAEMLLKEKYKNSINVSSAGLRPMVTAGMDPRSLNFLKKNNFHVRKVWILIVSKMGENVVKNGFFSCVYEGNKGRFRFCQPD